MTNEEYYALIARTIEANIPLWQATIISTDGSTPAKPGMKACIGSDELYFGNLGGGDMEHRIIAEIRKLKPETPMNMSFDLNASGKHPVTANDGTIPTAMICGGTAQIFIEPLHRSEILYIIGGGHCGRALAHMAHLCGLQPVIIDNREDVLTEARKLGSFRTILSDYTDIRNLIPHEAHAIVIMTHGHVHDKAVLEQCLDLSARYLGMIGSKKKVKETFDKLREQGIDQTTLDKVHAPIGLPIGSQTPYEIAISILAEIITERSKTRRKTH